MPFHIGIVACSAPGAALCYQTICSESAEIMGPHARTRKISMHSPSFAKYDKLMERDDWQGVGDLMLESADKLARIGADFLICPDNTIHQALPLIESRSPLPWLHIAEVVAEEAAKLGFRRLGLTGTRWLVTSEVYPEKLSARGLDYVRPSGEARDEMNRIIMDELVYGVLKPEGIQYFQGVIEGNESRRLRRGDPRLHRDPADHQRFKLRAADPRFHAPPGARGRPPRRRRPRFTLVYRQ